MAAAPHLHEGGSSSLRKLAGAMGLVALLAALEVSVGLLSGSLALLSDALHLTTDIATLGLTSFAVVRARRPADAQHTFGFHRHGILVATINALALLVVAFFLGAAAIARLQHPVSVNAGPVLGVATLALIFNGGLAVMLHGAGQELSIRSATLHVIGDAVASAGVIVSALVILLFGWQQADAAISIAIAVLIGGAAVGLLRETASVLSESSPRDIDTAAVRQLIGSIDGVHDVHDLHIWSLDRRHRALSAHVTVGDIPLVEVTVLLRAIETQLCASFGIEHATLQPECPSCSTDASLYCDIDDRHHALHLHATGAGINSGQK